MQIRGKVESVLVGLSKSGFITTPREFIVFALDGIEEDNHRGFIKKADTRDKPIPKRDGQGERVEVRNWRQWSAVSREELACLARDLELPEIKEEWLGANFTISGIPRFSIIPRGSTIWFPEDTVLTVEEINRPCDGPAKVIAAQYPDQDLTHLPGKFINKGWSSRGLVGTVYRAGVARNGDEIKIEVYEPRFFSAAN